MPLMRTGWMVIAAEGAINERLAATARGDADGVAAAEDERNSRLSHSRDELCDGETGFDVAADGIEQYEQTVDLVGLLNRGNLGDNVFVLGGFGLLGRFHVAFDLADDGDGVDDTAACFDCMASVMNV